MRCHTDHWDNLRECGLRRHLTPPSAYWIRCRVGRSGGGGEYRVASQGGEGDRVGA